MLTWSQYDIIETYSALKFTYITTDLSTALVGFANEFGKVLESSLLRRQQVKAMHERQRLAKRFNNHAATETGIAT